MAATAAGHAVGSQTGGELPMPALPTDADGNSATSGNTCAKDGCQNTMHGAWRLQTPVGSLMQPVFFLFFFCKIHACSVGCGVIQSAETICSHSDITLFYDLQISF